MSRRGWIVLALFAALLVGVPFAVLTRREFSSGPDRNVGEKVIRLAGQDWGYPAPFGFYPRGPGYVHMSMIFDTLVWKDQKGLTGLLASSWKLSGDGKRWTFTLRPNVRWHDGARLSARDAAFSFAYFKEHGFAWTDLGPIAGTQAPDDAHLVVELKEPYAPFLENVAGAVPIIPAHVWEKVGDPRKLSGPGALIGSGPFRLESYSRTHGTYRYAANGDYFLGRPRVGEIQHVAAGDPILALRKGEIDGLALFSRTLDAVGEFRDDPRFRTLSGPGDWVLRLVFNHAKAALARKDIRRAIAMCLDLEDVAGRLRHGHVEPAGAGFLPPSSPWHNPAVGKHVHDPEGAKALVRDSGLKDLRFTLLASPEYAREAEHIAGQLGRIGIAAAVKSLPASTLDAFLKEGDFELAVDGHGGIGGDPDVLRRQFCPPPPAAGASPGSGPTYGYSNAELNALGAAQLREADPEKRRALVFRMQEIIAAELPTVPLWHPRTYFVYDPKALDGWFYTPGGVAAGIPVVENKLVYIARRPR